MIHRAALVGAVGGAEDGAADHLADVQQRPTRREALQPFLPFGGRQLGTEAHDLVLENRELGRVRRERRTGLGQHTQDPAQHPRFARRQAVGTMRVPAERPGIAGECESGEGGADPHLVFLVGEDGRIEAADRVHDLAPEHRHDEERSLVGENLGQRDRQAVAAPQPRRKPVPRAAAIAGVADDDVDVRPCRQHGQVLGQKRVVPLVVAVEKGKEAAAGLAEPVIACRSRSGVRLPQHAHARVAGGTGLRNIQRAIR